MNKDTALVDELIDKLCREVLPSNKPAGVSVDRHLALKDAKVEILNLIATRRAQASLSFKHTNTHEQNESTKLSKRGNSIPKVSATLSS